VEREIEVHVDRSGTPVSAGRLWSRVRGGQETASFEYDAAWLERSDAFALDPELPLGRGPFHTHRPLFNAFVDPSPDRWGQNLLRRDERRRARREGRAPRTLFAIDFLLRVHDETRLGALRFREGGGDFLSSADRPVPPLVGLGRLLSATARTIDERESAEDLALLLAPGTSLGGARPKASVRGRDGALLVAKFPRKDDDWPVPRWEATALALAAAAGIDVPAWRLATTLRQPVVLLRRFDRDGPLRIPFMSALTALGASEFEPHSYLEIAEFVRREGAEADRDLRQLWRRLVFNILISNGDDHLRNHGFLRAARGWRLAPAYDLNPTPVDVRPRALALAVDESDRAASLDTARSAAAQFGMTAAQARSAAAEVGAAVTRWRIVAARQGLGRRHQDRMASAFEHDDLRAALRG
jgi:serine/threonine-protein kinase HipA